MEKLKRFIDRYGSTINFVGGKLLEVFLVLTISGCFLSMVIIGYH